MDSDSEIYDEEKETEPESWLENVEDEDEEMTGEEEPAILNSFLKPIIKKIRKTVNTFRRSPQKNEILQKYVKAQFGKQLNLLLDCRTRWSSLAAMCERFYLIRDCVKKALIDLKLKTVFEDFEIQRVSELVEALLNVKAAVEAICRRDANLITADAAINFVISKLLDQNYSVSLELSAAISSRIEERRTGMTKVLRYLHTRSFSNENENLSFNITRAEVQDFLKRIIIRTKPQPVHEPEANNPDKSEEALIVSDINIQDEINAVIKQAMTSANSETAKTSKSLLNTLKQEMKLFEDGGNRGYNLVYLLAHC